MVSRGLIAHSVAFVVIEVCNPCRRGCLVTNPLSIVVIDSIIGIKVIRAVIPVVWAVIPIIRAVIPIINGVIPVIRGILPIGDLC